MPSRDRRVALPAMSSGRRFAPTAGSVAVFLLALAFTLVLVITPARRSLYLVAVDGTVERVEVRHEKRPPSDDVHLLHLADGRTMRVDARVARLLQPGARVHKELWEQRVQVGKSSVVLVPSRDLTRSLLVAPLVLLVIAMLVSVQRD